MSRDLDVQYKTAFVLLHKVRESLMAQRDETPLTEAVQLDGAYVGGALRPANRVEDRQDQRLGEHRDPDRRCVLVLRQTPPASDTTSGATRTLSFIVQRENQDDVGRLAKRFITAGTPIAADESEAYNLLHAHFPVSRVNHSQAYRAEDGTNTNQAESFHARFQRMYVGQHHHFGLGYLANYANEIAYREDTRRWSNGEIFRDILTNCARTPHAPGLVRLLARQYRATRTPRRLRAPQLRRQARAPSSNATDLATPCLARWRNTANSVLRTPGMASG